jgi:hypothetical protein
MLNISHYLDRFKSIGLKEQFAKEAIVAVFAKYQIPLEKKQIKIKNNTVFVAVSSLAKSVVYRKKQTIIEEIASAPGGVRYTDIR